MRVQHCSPSDVCESRISDVSVLTAWYGGCKSHGIHRLSVVQISLNQVQRSCCLKLALGCIGIKSSSRRCCKHFPCQACDISVQRPVSTVQGRQYCPKQGDWPIFIEEFKGKRVKVMASSDNTIDNILMKIQHFQGELLWSIQYLRRE